MLQDTEVRTKTETIKALADDSQEQYICKLVMELMEFEELRNKKDLVYWTKYVSTFGTHHLITPITRFSWAGVLPGT